MFHAKISGSSGSFSTNFLETHKQCHHLDCGVRTHALNRTEPAQGNVDEMLPQGLTHVSSQTPASSKLLEGLALASGQRFGFALAIQSIFCCYNTILNMGALRRGDQGCGCWELTLNSCSQGGLDILSNPGDSTEAQEFKGELPHRAILATTAQFHLSEQELALFLDISSKPFLEALLDDPHTSYKSCHLSALRHWRSDFSTSLKGDRP